MNAQADGLAFMLWCAMYAFVFALAAAVGLCLGLILIEWWRARPMRRMARRREAYRRYCHLIDSRP